MDQYRVTDGLHHHDFGRSNVHSAHAQARGVLLMDPEIDRDRAELDVLRGEIWQRVDFVRNLRVSTLSEPAG